MTDTPDARGGAAETPAVAGPTSESAHPRHRQRGVLERLLDAVPLRTILLGLGVLALQMGFIVSYVGAFHQPSPRDIAVAVVAPNQARSQVVQKLDAIDGHPIEPVAYADAGAARSALREDRVTGVYVLDAQGKKDRMEVASAGGTSAADAATRVMTQVTASQGRSLDVTDVLPPQRGDARALSGFYLVVGWLVGGYLMASAVGVAKGAKPATLPRTLLRMGAMVPYCVLSGLLGAVAVDPLLGALTGHFMAIWGVGVLVSLAASLVTIGLQALFGIVGIGLAVVFFVILGNPSAGGAYQPEVMPPFWAAIHSWLPNGAGVEAIRRVVYFGAADVAGRLWVLVAWIVGGVLLALAGSALIRRCRAQPSSDPEGSTAT